MRRELVYSASALADLEAVLLYIACDSPQAARQWVAEIEKRCELLCDFPELGVERDDLAPGIRIFPIGGR